MYIVVLGSSQEYIKRLTKTLIREADQIGLQVNEDKNNVHDTKPKIPPEQ